MDQLLDDIFENRRTFLPGTPCTRDDVVANMRNPVLLGGLSEEESDLLLSALPAKSSKLWLEPLDKGLSGAKVFQARYASNGRTSKPFVIKLGPLKKIDREARAVNEIVSTTISGIAPAITRRGPTTGLVAQEFASLSETSRLQSLRERVANSEDGPELLTRLLHERLGRWYEEANTHEDFELGSLFAPYLSKAPGFDEDFPPQWDDLFDWVASLSGCTWARAPMAVAYAKARVESLPRCVVHGDLHTQNVLVDERGNCWPIDFAWTRDGQSLILDLVMLECSLKFLAVPVQADLRDLLACEDALTRYLPPAVSDRIPYAREIRRIVSCIQVVRDFGFAHGISEESYRLGLMLMTLAMSTHPGLNTPFVVSSLQLLAARVADDAGL